MVGSQGDRTERGNRRSALFVASPGGVLLDSMAVSSAWPGAPVSWVAVRSLDTAELLDGQDVTWATEPALRRPGTLIAEAVRAWRSLGSNRPDWVVSAGTAIAVPWFVAARLRRIPTLWIETLNLHGEQGLAARLCSRMSERVLVQRKDRLAVHRRCVLVGELY
ncbi:MAG: hypothetical protein KDB02_05875 [Acidimicrobiales bacterium]|nr:hypothetical protein [Acidimicrobiales bacterium]